MDPLFIPTNSIRQNKSFQLYGHKCGLYAPNHLSETNYYKIRDTQGNFILDYGVPDHLMFDVSLVLTIDGNYPLYITKK